MLHGVLGVKLRLFISCALTATLQGACVSEKEGGLHGGATQRLFYILFLNYLPPSFLLASGVIGCEVMRRLI